MDKKLTAPPAAGIGYVPRQQLAKNPNLPFDKAWIKQGVDWHRYRTRYIAPVNTDYLMLANWWQESIRANQCSRMSKRWRPSCGHNSSWLFRMIPPNHCVGVVMSPEKGPLTLAMAIMGLVSGHVLLNAIKIAGPYGSGLAAAALERGTEAQSTVAFEARVKDTTTGQTVAMFADRAFATARPIDL